jgi:hypothetical protein
MININNSKFKNKICCYSLASLPSTHRENMEFSPMHCLNQQWMELGYHIYMLEEV